jgi:hypothetical protein
VSNVKVVLTPVDTAVGTVTRAFKLLCAVVVKVEHVKNPVELFVEVRLVAPKEVQPTVVKIQFVATNTLAPMVVE